MPSSPEQVWQTLLDPEQLAKVIPGCHQLEQVGPDSYRADITLGIGAVRGRFEARVKLTDLDPPRTAIIAGDLQGLLGSSNGTGNIKLEAVAGGTQLSYKYGFEITGKVATVGGRMLDGAARVLMKQFFQKLASLAETSGETVGTAAAEVPPNASASTASEVGCDLVGEAPSEEVKNPAATETGPSWWRRLLK